MTTIFKFPRSRRSPEETRDERTRYTWRVLHVSCMRRLSSHPRTFIAKVSLSRAHRDRCPRASPRSLSPVVQYPGRTDRSFPEDARYRISS